MGDGTKKAVCQFANYLAELFARFLALLAND
jgi:hypothetical protein